MPPARFVTPLEAVAEQWRALYLSPVYFLLNGGRSPADADNAWAQIVTDWPPKRGKSLELSATRSGTVLIAGDAATAGQMATLARLTLHSLHGAGVVPPWAEPGPGPVGLPLRPLVEWCLMTARLAAKENVGVLCQREAYANVGTGGVFVCDYAARHAYAEEPFLLRGNLNAVALKSERWLLCPGGYSEPLPLGVVSVAVLQWLMGRLEAETPTAVSAATTLAAKSTPREQRQAKDDRIMKAVLRLNADPHRTAKDIAREVGLSASTLCRAKMWQAAKRAAMNAPPPPGRRHSDGSIDATDAA